MSVVMCSSDGRLHWDIQFRCPVQDWELEALDLFLDMLYSMDVPGYGADEACWKLAMRIGFEVRGFYHSLSPLLLSFLFLEKWCDNRKFLFFSWTAALGKILTTDILWIRHIAVLDWASSEDIEI